MLPRDFQLACNPDFCLKLSERLDRALRDNEQAEKAFLEQLPKLDEKAAAQERAKLDRERDYIQFLTASLGHFLAPSGVPVLCRIIEQEPTMELQPRTFRRRTAIKSLAEAGENLNRFALLSTQGRSLEQDLILEQLKKLDDTTRGEPRKWNEAARECLEKRKEGQFTTMGVDRALIQATESEDPVTRSLAALALGFWKGNSEQDRRMEEALQRLASDNGRGMDRLGEFQGVEPGETREILRQPGFLVQINATLSLLRRGSDKVRAGKVAEMLDPKQLGESIQIESKNGKREPDQSKVVMTVVTTLKALNKYYRHRSADSLPGIPERIKELTSSSNSTIQVAALEAERALQADAPK